MSSCQLATLGILEPVSSGKTAISLQGLVLQQSHDAPDRFRVDEHNLKHVFKESMPQLETRSDIMKRNRVDHDHLHRVIFVIRQKNMSELVRILHDVSDPASSNYGQHLTRDEVAVLTSNPESRDALNLYLLSKGVDIVSETISGEYVTGEASIDVWERMFNTAFFVFHQTQQNGPIREMVRAEMYSIPRELDEHVQSVLNTVEMPQARRGTQATQKMNDIDFKLAALPGVVTPDKLKAFYNMSKSVGSKRSTQAIFATGEQNFSPVDLKKFQMGQKLLVQPAMNISGRANHTVCLVTSYLCGESNLDIQWIMATSQGSPTTHWYTDNYFHEWLTSVADANNPPLVLSISYGSEEQYVTDSVHDAFTTQAIKCGTMGITILASSGDDGVLSNTVRGGHLNKCKYEPDFPAGNPYVTAVGATSVSCS
jgi:tripeptidyl-peptidase I